MIPLTKKQAAEQWAAHCLYVQNATPVDLTESANAKYERIERAKKDFAFFVAYYFPHYCANAVGGKIATPRFHTNLANLTKRNKLLKVLVRWGRGLAKSVICDTLLPLWLWIDGENIYLVLVGNTYEKACILLSDLKVEFQSNMRFRNDFGDQLTTSKKWTEGAFSCRERFTGKAIGMGQDARGLRDGAQRPNLIVADDLEDKDTIKNPLIQDEVVSWIETSLLPTMDGDTRRFFDVNNNFAPRTIQSLLEKSHTEWVLHQVDACPGAERVPAWSAKYDANYYKVLEKEIGTIALESEYNNRPMVKGKIFKQEHIQWARLPKMNKFEFIVGRWDPAYSGNNDYNAVKIWGLYEHNFYLIGCFVRQCTMGSALDWIFYTDKNMEEGVIVHWRVEAQFWNQPLKDEIDAKEAQHGGVLNISVVSTPKTKKLDRMLSMHPYYENKRIFYNEKLKGDNDCSVAIAQLFAVEPGSRAHDDSPDADERAISDLRDVDRRMSFEPAFGAIKHLGAW